MPASYIQQLTRFTFRLPYGLVCYDTHHLTFHRNGTNAISTTMLPQTGEWKEQKENPKSTP
jgi:hypothetical protein